MPRNALFFAVHLAFLHFSFEIRDFEKSKDLILLIVNIFAVSQLHSRLHLPFLYSGVALRCGSLHFELLMFRLQPNGSPLARRLRIPMLLLLPVIFVAFLRREHWFAALLTFIVWYSGTLAHLVAILVFLGFYLVASIGLKSERFARSYYVIFIISF